MVKNYYYKCDACETSIRFRFQIGAFNMPISVYCPKCNCHIEGSIAVDNENVVTKSSVLGAHEYDSKDNFADYVVELSTEFLVNKCVKDSPDTILPSMFLRSDIFNDEKNQKRANLLYATSKRFIYINIIENIYNLLDTEQIDLLKQYLIMCSSRFVKCDKKVFPFDDIKNKLDAILASKHFINTLLIPFMTPGTFSGLYDVMDKKIRDIITKHQSAFKEFLRNIDDYYFDIYWSRIPKFVIEYLKCVNQLIPIYECYEKFDSVDLNTSGISTISIDDMVVIYKKGYELICDSIDLLTGLYNIENFGTYDNFGHASVCDFTEKMNSYSSKYKKYEDATNNNSSLFDNIRGTLNRVIRNAEGHNSIKINGLEQTVTFINRHKGNVDQETISFLEFGKKCIDVFIAVLYLWEYYYQLTKFKLSLVDQIQLNYGLGKIK